MSEIFNNILTEVDRGRQGLNSGISMGLPKLEGIIDGVTQGTYTLIISSSGSGKSSFSLYSYVYRPLMEHLDDDDFKVLYISLEMSELSMFIKLLSIYIFETYGKKLSYKEILSKKRGYKLDEEGYQMILKCKDWIDKISSKIEFYDKNVSADSLYAILCSRLESCGKFTETETRKTYVPNNPNLTYVIVLDHIGLVRPKAGRTIKQEIDLVSSYLVTLREMCNISPVVIQQANREQANQARLQAGMTSFSMNDAKDSGNTVNDCSLMLAIYDPFKMSQKTHRGYKVDEIPGRFRTCQVLKNRFGECDVEVGLNFFGEINYFKELPTPDKIQNYSQYQEPDYILEELLLDKAQNEEKRS